MTSIGYVESEKTVFPSKLSKHSWTIKAKLPDLTIFRHLDDFMPQFDHFDDMTIYALISINFKN